LPHFLQSIEEI